MIEEFGDSRHFTFIFNTFVFMQIFNLICARKVHDELNVFAGIFDNITFIALFFVICAGQILITIFGSRVFAVCPKGLTGPQWGISIAIGVSSFVVDFISKFLPDWLFPKLGKDSVDDRRAALALQLQQKAN